MADKISKSDKTIKSKKANISAGKKFAIKIIQSLLCNLLVYILNKQWSKLLLTF